MARTVEYARELAATQERVARPHLGWWIAILSGMTLLGILALSPTAHAAWSEGGHELDAALAARRRLRLGRLAPRLQGR